MLGGSNFRYQGGAFRGNVVGFSTGPGWSGGPLFNQEGKVCGLLDSSDSCTSVFITFAATREAYVACRNRPATKPTLYVFGSVHCGPCLKFKQQYADQAKLRQRLDARFSVVFVDIDVHPGTADQFGIKEVPAFVVPGQSTITGYTEPGELLDKLGVRDQEPERPAIVDVPPKPPVVSQPPTNTEPAPAPTPPTAPQSECIECHTERMPKAKSFGFCQKHGVAECVIDHPELAQVKGDPQLPRYDTIEAITLMPRSENNSRNTLHTSRIQFSSAESISKAGIDVDVVQERPMIEAITANGELMFDPTHVAHLSTRVSGSVAVVFKAVGDPVTAGDVLALVDAAQVGQAKSQLQQAVVQLQSRQFTVSRLRPAATSGAVSQRSLVDAEVALQEAEVTLISTRQALANLGLAIPEGLETHQAQALAEELRFLGLPDEAVGALPVGSQTANLIPVRAPFDGVVTASQIVVGEVVDASKALFTVCDPSRMWLMLNVRQEDANHARLGLPVRFRSDDGVHRLEGQIAWISPAVDERTRTIQVRVTIANSTGTLRDKTFGTGQIIQRQEPNAIVVPRDAVQSTSDASFVFVRDKHFFDEDAPKFFHVRQVRIGARDDQFVELLAGVLPGEVIATKGSNVLLSQLLRSQLGAGCGCHEE